MMEEAILKLIKIVASDTKYLYQFGENPDDVVKKILNDAELTFLPQYEEQLFEFFRTLN